MKKVVCRLEEFAEERGTNLSALSRKVDVNYLSIVRMAKNKTSSYDLNILNKIINAYDIPLSEIIILKDVEE